MNNQQDNKRKNHSHRFAGGRPPGEPRVPLNREPVSNADIADVADVALTAASVFPAVRGVRGGLAVAKGAAKLGSSLAKSKNVKNFVSRVGNLFKGGGKATTKAAPKPPKPPKPPKRGKLTRTLTKTLSKFDLPSLPSLNGLSAATSAVRKMTKSKEEEEEEAGLKKEAYQWLGITLLEKSAAWTRSEGKNPSGGLNAKGVASYRAQNPGSKLKTAVTTKPSKLKKGSKAANRRKSFCARMKGMRKRQKSSNNTGKDRLSLSLKKWNC